MIIPRFRGTPNPSPEHQRWKKIDDIIMICLLVMIVAASVGGIGYRLICGWEP